MTDSCGAPDQDALADEPIPAGQTVVAGQVRDASGPVPGAFVRLLDGSGEFLGEVVSARTGRFRFYARPGDLTVSVLSARGSGRITVTAAAGGLTAADLTLS